MELFVSLDGVGLSLVNSKPDELVYIKLRRCVSHGSKTNGDHSDLSNR